MAPIGSPSPTALLRAFARLRPALAAVLALALGAAVSRAQVIREPFPITNGTVNAVVVSGTRLYLGGNFTSVGPVTGTGVTLSAATGAVAPGLPRVNGQVNAVVPDGAGGWFIGGAFTTVGGLARGNVAHVLSDQTVAAWNPVVNGQVLALAYDGATLYLGGSFNNVAGQVRNNLAAVDGVTGVATAWDPSASSSVRAMALGSGVIYVGGSFTSIGASVRNRIGAVSLATGLPTAWDPNAGSTVRALVTDGVSVYAGGDFPNVGGQPRSRIAALDVTTGLATTWNPGSNGQVSALALSGSTLYAGGAFTLIGGQARNRVAAIGVATGTVSSWNPNAGAQVLTLAVDGSTVYAGGDFLSIGGQSRSRIAALDASSGLATAWNPNAYGAVFALAAAGPDVFAGGSFTGMGGTVRNNLASIDLGTGTLTAWNPDLNGEVLALAVRGSRLYVGGSFTTIGVQVRNGLAAFEIGTGLDSGWNPNVGGRVTAMALADDRLYLGGVFGLVGGFSRTNLAAVDLVTGALLPWNPGTDGEVFSLAVEGSTVYAGGSFMIAGGMPRSNLAALDAVSGTLLAWDPNPNGTVRALELACGKLYAGGFFTTIGGQARNRAAVLDPATGLAGAWNPNSNGPVFAIDVQDRAAYVSGVLSNIGGQSRNRLAVLDAVTGNATAWNPNAAGTVRALAIGGGAVFAGGSYSAIGSTLQTNIASTDLDLSLTCPVVTITPGSLPALTLGVPFSTTFAGSGGVAPYCLALTGALPTGLTFDASSGLLSGTPTAAGAWTFTITATDANGCTGSQAYSVSTACPAIALAPATLPGGLTGAPYSQTVTASAGAAPLTYAVTSGALPPGLALAPSTGAITGAVTGEGTYAFTITVTDAVGCTGSQAYSATFACPVMAMAPPALPAATLGVPYSETITSTGGIAPVTFAVTTGALPPGLTLASGGALTGTPTTAGSYPFTVRATGAAGCFVETAYTIAASCPALAVAPATLPNAVAGTPYSQSVSAAPGTGPFAWNVTVGALPPGLALDSGSGAITGTPAAPGGAFFTVHVSDAYGCEASASYSLGVLPAGPNSLVGADATGLCLSTAHPSVALPVNFARVEATPARALSVTFQLDPAHLALVTPGTPAASIHPGPWLGPWPDALLSVTDQGGGAYTVDIVLLGAPCGETAGGTLFTVDLEAVGGDGTGTVTVTSAVARDCDNVPIAVLPGGAATLPISHTAPAAIADLAGAQVRAGNGAGTRTGITLTWTAPGADHVELWRAPFGAYPLYDAGGPVSPPDPNAAPGAPWTLVSANAVSGVVDVPPARGFWYHVAFAVDACGNRSAVSNATSGALDYFLGDVTDGATPGTGDNAADDDDVSLLGAHYGLTGGAIATAGVSYLDVGPTGDASPASRPHPDLALDFEDFMLVALDYGVVSAPALAAAPATPERPAALDQFQLSGPAFVTAGNSYTSAIVVTGTGAVQGFSAQLAWNAGVAQVTGYAASPWFDGQNGEVLSPSGSVVDAVLLGPRVPGLSGTQVVVLVHFLALANGAPDLHLVNVVARDRFNQPVPVQVTVTGVDDAAPPARTEFAAPWPNPGRGSATLAFALAHPGRVELDLFGVDGRLVKRLADGERAAGRYRLAWDGTDASGRAAAPGLYYARLRADGRTFVQKLVRLDR